MKILNLTKEEWKKEYRKSFEKITFKTKQDEENFGDYIVNEVIANIEKKIKDEFPGLEFNYDFNPCYHLSCSIYKDKDFLSKNFFLKVINELEKIGKPHNWTVQICLEEGIGDIDWEKIDLKNCEKIDNQPSIQFNQIVFKEDPNEIKINIEELFIKDQIIYISTTNDVFKQFQNLILNN